MNITVTNGSAVKNQLYSGNVDFDSTTFKAILMRSGFSFNTSNHKNLKNIQTSTSGMSTYVTISSSAKTFTRTDGGSFITDGFVVGNYVTATGTDAAVHANGVYQVASVSAGVLRVSIISGTMVDNHVSSPGPPIVYETVDIELHADDEKPTGEGWTHHTWLTTPTIGFTVGGTTLQLDSFDISDFGTAPAAGTSPGAIIFDDNVANDKVIICYIKFAPWTLAF